MAAALLSVLLILGQTEGKTILNAESLVDRDWSSDAQALSLQPGDLWSEGTAWFFRYDEGPNAWKGKYKFFRPSDATEDVLILQIGFIRRYDLVREKTKSKWVLYSSYKPKGMNLEIPLEESRVPDDNVQFSVIGGFWADADGKPTTRTTKANGILGNVFGIEEEYKLRSLDNATIGDTLQLSDSADRRFQSIALDYPPPAFKARIPKDKRAFATPTKPTVTLKPVAKPATSSSSTHSSGTRYPDTSLSPDHQSSSYLRERARANQKLGKYDSAVADYLQWSSLSPDDPEPLNAAAWLLAVRREFSESDAADALTLARKASALTQHKNAMHVDTLAAAYARSGDFAAAVRAQREAVRLAADTYKAEMTARLRLYEAGKQYFE